MSLAFRWMSQILTRQRPEMVPVDGARLSRLGPSAWVADREVLYSGRYSVPLRMVVLRNASGALSLYSPVALDDRTREALAGLGEVTRVVAPNRFHTRFVGRTMDNYPDAVLLLPESNAGLVSRFSDRARIITGTEQLDDGLEVRAVRLREGFEELVLYHDPSESLVLCDLLFNFQQAGSELVRWLYRLNGVWRRPAQSRLQRRMLIKDLENLGRFYRWAMSKPFSQISMAHGQLINTDAREHFYQLFREYGQ